MAQPLQTKNLLPYDVEAFLIEAALPPEMADGLLASLMHTIAWRSATATMMGRSVAIPRLTAWYGDGDYTYICRMGPAS